MSAFAFDRPRQAEQIADKVARQKRDAMEAVEWCTAHLQVEPAAAALRTAGAMREQRSVLLVQFIGTQYKGMQLQNRSQVHTVEGALLHALYKAGGVDPTPGVNLAQLRWTRTARTDGGVHAAFNVVSCVLQWYEGLTERVNTFLPHDIRLLQILPVADLSHLLEARAARLQLSPPLPSAVPEAAAFALHTYGFHPRESCSGRDYEYIVPVALWLDAPALPLPAGAAVASAAAEPAQPAVSASDRDALPSAASSTALDDAVQRTSGSSQRHRCSSASTPPTADAAPGVLFAPLFVEPLPSAAPSFDLDFFHRARLTDGDVARLNRILQRFEGVKRSYHNFANPTEQEMAFLRERARKLKGETSTQIADEPEQNAAIGSNVAAAADSVLAAASTPEPDFLRTVSRCCISDVFVHPSGAQFARVVIEGKSFAFNQIRKIIGLASLVARGRIAESIFDTAFDERTLLDVPIAPARGLLLRRPLFAHYDAACAETQQEHLSLGRAYAALQPDQSAFVRELLEGEVCSPRASHACYRTFLFTTYQQAVQQNKQMHAVAQANGRPLAAETASAAEVAR